MGTQPGKIEQEIEQQRERIGEKVASLRERLRTDAHEAQAAAQRQAHRAGEQTKRGLAYIGGAFGLGVALALGYSVWRNRSKDD